MKPKLLLRIAAILMILHAAGHTIGALTWKKAPNAAVENVINGMQANHFQFMGRDVTLAGFFEGYGISLIFVLLFVSILLWLLSGSSQKAMMLVTALFLLAFAISEFVYFFPMAASFSLVSGLCCLVAALQQKTVMAAKQAPVIV